MGDSKSEKLEWVLTGASESTIWVRFSTKLYNKIGEGKPTIRKNEKLSYIRLKRDYFCCQLRSIHPEWYLPHVCSPVICQWQWPRSTKAVKHLHSAPVGIRGVFLTFSYHISRISKTLSLILAPRRDQQVKLGASWKRSRGSSRGHRQKTLSSF